jgi:hypothetical protein
LEADNEGDMEDDVQKLWVHAIRIYLLYLVGITLFTNKNAYYVDVVYLRYFRDLVVVAGYSWGAATLSYLYKELNNVSHYNTKHLGRYLTLLEV